MTDRGVSTMLSYTLTLAMVTLLVSGLFLTAGGYVEDQRERAIRSELTVIGNRIAADLGVVDRLALESDDSHIRLRTDIPESVAGSSYRLSIESLGSPSPYAINLTTTEPDVVVSVTVKLAMPVVPTTISGGDVSFAYDGTKMEVSRD